MEAPTSGSEFLKQLREKTEKKEHRFHSLEEYIHLKAREKGIPVSGKFELTPLCNFDCKMCYVHLVPDQLNDYSILPVDTWKDLIHQAWEQGMISATLTGGECLTYPGFDELFLYLHDLGCKVNVLTNGSLLNEKRIQFFKKHRPSNIQVTLYGCNDSVYERVTGQRSFTTVVNNYVQARDAGLPVYFSITPNKYLGEDLLETIRVAKELCNNVKVNYLFTTPRKETGRSEQKDDADFNMYVRADKYYYQLEGYEIKEVNERDLPPCGGPYHDTTECGLKCGGGRSNFAIDWKGTMTPCTDLDMICSYPLIDGFAAAWKKINKEVNQWSRIPECIECPYYSVCHNCAANALRYAEPGKQPVELCRQTRELVRNGILHIPDCE